MSGKIILLGTGTSQGIPVIGCTCHVCKSDNPRDKRFRTSAYLEVDGVKLLIDCGPDFRQQMLMNEISEIDAVLLTHEHRDHTAGLDDLRPIIFKQGKPMPVYCNARTLASVREQYSYAFAEKRYPGAPEFNLIEIDNLLFEIKGVQIEPVEVYHGEEPIMGFKVGRVAYLTDVKYISEKEKEKIKGLDILILSALRHEEHHSHQNYREAVLLGKESGAGHVVFVHMSHHMGKDLGVVGEGMEFGYDGMCIKI
jgi:phosphoribosyl 1,2-cyclic phosphate phosphodiesterase